MHKFLVKLSTTLCEPELAGNCRQSKFLFGTASTCERIVGSPEVLVTEHILTKFTYSCQAEETTVLLFLISLNISKLSFVLFSVRWYSIFLLLVVSSIHEDIPREATVFIYLKLISYFEQGKVSLISVDGLHQLHILIFFLAVFHVIYSAVTMALGRLKVTESLLVIVLGIWLFY